MVAESRNWCRLGKGLGGFQPYKLANEGKNLGLLQSCLGERSVWSISFGINALWPADICSTGRPFNGKCC